MSSGIVARVMQSRNAEIGAASDFDQHFTSKFGSPADGKLAPMPLLLKDKVSAFGYADGGAQAGTLDAAALDVLVRATSAWLEVVSQRKQAQKDGAPEPEMHSAPSANDPFAADAPFHPGKHDVAEAAISAEAAQAGTP